MLAIVVVIGLQLLPERPLERLQIRIEKLRPAVLGTGFAVAGPVRRRHGVEPGRRPLHLLPLLSEPADRRQPHEPLRRARPPPLPRARRDRRRHARLAAARALRGRRRCGGPASRWTPGWAGDIVLAVGKPAGWIADRLPLAERRARATSWLSPDAELDARDAFTATANVAGGGRRRAAGHRRRLRPRPDRGEAGPPKRQLRTLLVTGDSMSTPLDAEMGRAAGRRGRARDPRPAPRHRHLEELPRRLGTAVRRARCSATTPTPSWSSSAPTRASRWRGPAAARSSAAARTGPPRTPTACAGWSTPTGRRARRGSTGSGCPLPRAANRQRISRVVNEAVEVATQPWRGQVRVVDTSAIFTPHGYRDAMPVGRRGDASFARPTASTSTSGARGCWRPRCWNRSARTTCTSADRGLTTRGVAI